MTRAFQGRTGVLAALGAAVLFGAGTPVAKLLLGQTSPWLLYTASGAALGLWRLLRHAPRVRLARRELAPLAGAVLFGGILVPVLLMLELVPCRPAVRPCCSTPKVCSTA